MPCSEVISTMVEAVPSLRYVRTPAGQAEIGARALGLSRAARNLLLVINTSKTLGEWMSAMPALAPSEVEHMLSQGLLAPEAPPEPASTNHPDEVAWQALTRRINQANYSLLSAALTQQAKEHFGLVRNYRMVLEVEKANGIEALRLLAVQFALEIRREKGMAVLHGFYRALG